MPYVRIDPAKSPYGMLNYLDDDKGHNGNKDRNVMISYVNMDPEIPYKKQFREVWNNEKSTVKRHAYVIIQSFSKNELDPSDPQSYLTANLAGNQLAYEFGKGRQAVVFTQIDGQSGLVHNHIFINNVHPYTHECFQSTDIVHEYYSDGKPVMVRNKKGELIHKYHVNHGETYQPYVRELSDKVCAEFITLDPGLNKGRSYSHAEYALHEENKVIDAENDEITAENKEIKKYNEEHKDKPKPEKELKQRRYVWKDDLRSRIDQAVTESSDWDDFVLHLDVYHHIDVREGKYITYTLRDKDDYAAEEKLKYIRKQVKEGRPEKEVSAEADDMDFMPKRKLSARSNKLGSGYSREAVEERLKEKRQAEHERIVAENNAALETLERQAAEAQRYTEEWDAAGESDNDSSGSTSSGGMGIAEEKKQDEQERKESDLDQLKTNVAQVLNEKKEPGKPVPEEQKPEVLKAAEPVKISEDASVKSVKKSANKPSGEKSVKTVPEQKPAAPVNRPVSHGFVYIDVPAAMVSDPVTSKNGAAVVSVRIPFSHVTGEFRVAAQQAVPVEGTDKVRLKLRDDGQREVHWKDPKTGENKKTHMYPDRLKNVYARFDERVKARKTSLAEKYDDVNEKEAQDDDQYGG